MNEKLLKYVLRFRLLIYLFGFISIVASQFGCTPKKCYECIIYRQTIELIDNDIVFWPPDMIPHPVIPGDEPCGPYDPVDA